MPLDCVSGVVQVLVWLRLIMGVGTEQLMKHDIDRRQAAHLQGNWQNHDYCNIFLVLYAKAARHECQLVKPQQVLGGLHRARLDRAAKPAPVSW
jgi:hypothetical protein